VFLGYAQNKRSLAYGKFSNLRRVARFPETRSFAAIFGQQKNFFFEQVNYFRNVASYM
jgi:hypothetical protein